MTTKLKIQLAQINPTVGDLSGNAEKILREFERANQAGCDLVVFGEMAICGYDCGDLWQKKYFVDATKEKILEILAATKGSKSAILLGAPTFEINRAKKEIFYNSALLLENGEIKKIVNKKTLANHGVFDEKRYFESASTLSLVEFRGLTLAILICEDLWNAKNLFLLQEQILDAVISLNASPYSTQKHLKRRAIAQNFAKNLGKPLVYLNQVGAQDGLVFDGDSFVMNGFGQEALKLREFVEDFAIVEIEKSGEIFTLTPTLSPQGRGSFSELGLTLSPQGRGSDSELGLTPSPLRGEGWGEGEIELARDYSAAVLGLRDYIQKNGFKKVLLGMSGGVDSALVAAIAVDALGAENVALYALPSRFNSETSMIDALNCAKNLRIKLAVISIEEPFKAMLTTLGEISQLTQENLQARIRGNILMALSNNSGALLLSTGNKSELACGYATLYGDMCGAFNPIKDFYKTRVFELANWRNENFCEISTFKEKNLIPQNILTKAPSAELRDNQKDSDSLPEYAILDQILFALIEEQKSTDEIIATGFESELVKKVAKLFYSSEYKRRQSCLGPKVSEMAFDKDRRFPITNKFTK
jgi:NAD+ synthase